MDLVAFGERVARGLSSYKAAVLAGDPELEYVAMQSLIDFLAAEVARAESWAHINYESVN